jgi:predicted O-methyltransferase YrrM
VSGRVGRRFDRALDRLRDRLDDRSRRRHEIAPLCAAPLAPPDEYRRLWAEARTRSYPDVDRYEERCDAAVDRDWLDRLALVTQVAIKQSEICYQHGRLLYATLARYARSRVHDHLTIIETGTARGFSAVCLARALADAGASGKIVSFDVLPHDVPILWNCIRDAEGPHTRSELLRDYAALLERYVIFHRGDTGRMLADVSVPRIHFAFLDSVHEYGHVMAEFAPIRCRQQPGDILFFDDYTPAAYPGVVKAADEICRTAHYSATIVAANAGRQYLIAEKQGRS